MKLTTPVLVASIVLLAFLGTARGDEPISPQGAPIKLFNGKNLDGLYTWLSDKKYEDPGKVFTVEDGMLRISGDGFGYVATKQRFKNYHLVAEYRWGGKTWQSRKTNARDSGLIVHCIEPDGSFGNTFMGGIEAQVIEGGTGDILVVVGNMPDGKPMPITLTAETAKDRDGETIWKKGGERKTFNTFVRVNWFGRDPDWKDVVDYRGKQDIESPGKEWTRLDVICDGGHIQYLVNGTLANEAFDVSPSSGKILFQTEGAEVYVRRFELLPLDSEKKESK